jgi:hypothetical protein
MKLSRAGIGVAVWLMAQAANVHAQSCTVGDPVSRTTQFAPGSLVIPMDTCYNPDTGTQSGGLDLAGACVANAARACFNSYGGGNLRLPFGLIYLLAENNIPVSVILNNAKLGLGDPDFSVTPPAGSTRPTATHLVPGASGYTLDQAGLPCGTNTVSYSGMPFVIDASYARQALQVITTFNNSSGGVFSAVTLHTINYAFSAPVIEVLQSRPKPVVVDGSPLDTFFSESQIPAVAAPGSTYVYLNGASPSYTYTWPATLPANPACPGGTCSALTWMPPGASVKQRIVDVLWDQQGQPVSDWTAIPSFFHHGGVVLSVDAADSWESGAGGGVGGGMQRATRGNESDPYCATVATTNANLFAVPGPAAQYPASNLYFQIDLFALDVHGNGGGADGASSYSFATSPANGTVGLSNGDGYESIAGHPIVSGTQAAGEVVYLGSLNSWHGNSTNKDGGLHIMYNTLLAGGADCSAPFANTELTRSDAVANTLTTASGGSLLAEYQGTFDWKIPADPTAGGNVLYEPDPTQYPYVTGHFREYKQPGAYTVDANTTYTRCDPSDTHSACDWDAATLMKPMAQRRVYVVTGSADSWQLSPIASVNDPTVNYVRAHLDTTDALGNPIGILGGVDYSTAAVIEAVPNGQVTVAGAKSRPMIAYVGARDGMLHAFCVQPPSGSSRCYGLAAPGEELWAIITPGALARLRDAYNGGSAMDWSHVNMGGAVRVADIKDTFEGQSGYRTVLLVGAHDAGFVDAIDISSPDPGQLLNGSAIGFAMLWESDGRVADATLVTAPATQTWMGPTHGATIAMMGQGSAVAMVTSASCATNPTLRNQGATPPACAATVGNGLNTYVLRIADGTVVGFDARPYARASSLFNEPIANGVPALPTTLDSDGDGIYESAFVASFEGYVRRYTLKPAATPPTVGVLDPAKPAFVLFDASASCTPGVACQPIGASPTLLANSRNGPSLAVLVATGGVDWARAATDAGDLTATTNLSYVYGFDAQATATTSAYFSRSFGGVTTPTSAAAGSAPGVVSVPLSLRGYASLTVSGTDLYADVTSVGLNTIAQLVQLVEPAITPGTWGATLRWSNVSSGSGVSAIATNVVGGGFSGGASSVIAAAPSGNAVTFVTSVDGKVASLTAPSTSTPSPALAVVKPGGGASGSRPFNVLTWFDL